MSSVFLPSWIVLPAAGTGSRMQADKPKQYLQLGKHTVLEQTLNRLSQLPNVKGLVIALSENDKYWQAINKPVNIDIITVIGGEERCDSVFNALQAIAKNVDQNDWVMVHDAARPCFSIDDIAQLHQSIAEQNAAGGILALPVADTLKRVNHDNAIQETVSREKLWRALTPQMFPYQVLYKALNDALQKNTVITDDSQVVELTKQQPIVVESSPMNIKITQPRDLRLAEIYLQELDNDN